MSTSDQSPEAQLRAKLTQARRIVVKVGSAVLSSPQQGLAAGTIRAMADAVSGLMRGQRQVVLVSSGAVAEGVARLGWSKRPDALHELQAAAAVGQMGLIQAYESAFAVHKRHTALVLLTHDDLANRKRYLNARSTLTRLLELGVVPVINENDSVATDEIRFGDNDTLAALVANLLEADLLVLMTDVAQLYTADPRQDGTAQAVHFARADDPALDAMAASGVGALGRGGMATKIRAARIAARSGAHTVIMSGHEPALLGSVFAGQRIGSLLQAEQNAMDARKRWIAGQLRARGDLQLDDGAVEAVESRRRSLLPVGLVAVRGEFERGDVVRLLDGGGRLVAQGLVNYPAADVRRLVGCSSAEIAGRLGYLGEPELVHRDNLVVFTER